MTQMHYTLRRAAGSATTEMCASIGASPRQFVVFLEVG